MSKVCRKCKHELPLSQFGKSSKFDDGIDVVCKQCHKKDRFRRAFNKAMQRPSEIIGAKYKYKVKAVPKGGDGGGRSRFHFHDKFGDEILPDDQGEWLTTDVIKQKTDCGISTSGLLHRLKTGNVSWNGRKESCNRPKNTALINPRPINGEGSASIRSINRFVMSPIYSNKELMVDGGIPASHAH